MSSEHWYEKDGTPAYETRAASGLLRPTTLADARKRALCPSVTTCLNVVAKPALTNWMVTQGVLAALTLPRIDGESEAELLDRIRVDGQASAKAAAQEGSRIHDAVECHFKGSAYPNQYKPHVQAVRRTLWELFPGVEDWVSETRFAHPMGYAGMVDLHSPSTGIVVDIKTKDGDFSDGKKLAYDQHWQLSGYHRGLRLHPNRCANIFASRTHPDCVASHVWTEAKMEEGWAVFAAALALWKAINRFDPAFTETDNG